MAFVSVPEKPPPPPPTHKHIHALKNTDSVGGGRGFDEVRLATDPSHGENAGEKLTHSTLSTSIHFLIFFPPHARHGGRHGGGGGGVGSICTPDKNNFLHAHCELS